MGRVVAVAEDRVLDHFYFSCGVDAGLFQGLLDKKLDQAAAVLVRISTGESGLKQTAKIPACRLQATSISNNRIARQVKFTVTPDAGPAVPLFSDGMNERTWRWQTPNGLEN